jgi:hypothetical protein
MSSKTGSANSNVVAYAFRGGKGFRLVDLIVGHQHAELLSAGFCQTTGTAKPKRHRNLNGPRCFECICTIELRACQYVSTSLFSVTLQLRVFYVSSWWIIHLKPTREQPLAEGTKKTNCLRKSLSLFGLLTCRQTGTVDVVPGAPLRP